MDEKPRNTRKRKHRKSAIKNAKKYAKKGCFGRGTRVDEETYHYFLRIHELGIEKYENEEEKAMLASNALEQTKGREVDLAMNQFISRVTETLLPYASDEDIERFITSFNDLRLLCTNNFSSHVVQTLIKVCAERFQAQGKERFRDFVLKTSLFVFNNLEEFIYNSYANQVGRTCLKACADFANKYELFEEAITKLGTRIFKWPQIKDLASNSLTSAFLQCLLDCLSVVNCKLTKKVIKRLLHEYFLCFNGENIEDVDEKIDSNESTASIPIFFSNMPSTRLLETIIQVSQGKNVTIIYLDIFMNRLKALACNKLSVFAVQKLIVSCKEVSEFNLIIDELIPSFPEIIAIEHKNILLELAKGCIRFGVKEGEFLKGLKIGLKVENTCRGELFTQLIFTEVNDVKKVDLHGSLILQELFSFKKPISIVESMLAVDSRTLTEIFNDPRGCHVVDAFVGSKSVGEKSRVRLVQTMKGHYKELAMDKFGSRAIEALWSRAALKERHIIIGELDRSLCKTMYGSIISEKFRLGLYLSDKNKWVKTAFEKKNNSDVLET